MTSRHSGWGGLDRSCSVSPVSSAGLYKSKVIVAEDLYLQKIVKDNNSKSQTKLIKPLPLIFMLSMTFFVSEYWGESRKNVRGGWWVVENSKCKKKMTIFDENILEGGGERW